MLRCGGRLIVHTYPNRNAYEFGYRYYTRFSAALLKSFRIINREDLYFFRNPRNTDVKLYHINEQTPHSLRKQPRQYNFEVRVCVSEWHEPTSLKLLIRKTLLAPGLFFPLNQLFGLNIWAEAKNGDQSFHEILHKGTSHLT